MPRRSARLVHAPEPQRGFPLTELPPDLISFILRKSTARAIIKLSETSIFFRRKCLEVGRALLEEMWKMFAPASLAVRAMGADAVHTLALFTGQRPMVPAPFYVLLQQSLRDFDTVADIDLGALERLYLILGDVTLAAFDPRCWVQEGVGGNGPRNDGTDWLPFENGLPQALSNTFYDFVRLLEGIFSIDRRHYVTTRDVSQAVALLLRNAEPRKPWTKYKNCDVDDELDDWNDGVHPDAWYAQEEINLEQEDEIDEEYSDEFVRISEPVFTSTEPVVTPTDPEAFVLRTKTYPDVAKFFQDPRNFACRRIGDRTIEDPRSFWNPLSGPSPEGDPMVTRVLEAPGPFREFREGNVAFWNDPDPESVPNPAYFWASSKCCEKNCLCCSTKYIFRLAMQRTLEEIPGAGPTGEDIPSAEEAAEHLDVMNRHLHELAIEVSRRRSLGPQCAKALAHRAARKRFAEWREMGAGPAARSWLEGKGLRVRFIRPTTGQ